MPLTPTEKSTRHRAKIKAQLARLAVLEAALRKIAGLVNHKHVAMQGDYWEDGVQSGFNTAGRIATDALNHTSGAREEGA